MKIKNFVLVLFMVLALTGVAFADSDSHDVSVLSGNSGNAVVNSPSATGGTVNNTQVGGTFSPTFSPDVNATGGAGGAGGAGGSVIGSGNSMNINAPSSESSAKIGNITNTNTATGGAGGSAVIEKGAIDNKNTNTNLNTNLNSNTNKVDVKNTNTNVGINKQDQGQIQGQMNNWSQTYINERELLGAPQIIPMPIPLIQGGKVGDVTAQVVRFAIQGVPYKGDMKVVKVLKIVKGSIFDRTRLEDIEEDFLDAWKGIVNKYGSKNFDLSKVAYLVQYKDSSMGAGVGGGGAASMSGFSGTNGMAGTLAVLPGYTRSTTDPAYFIKFFLVE